MAKTIEYKPNSKGTIVLDRSLKPQYEAKRVPGKKAGKAKAPRKK